MIVELSFLPSRRTRCIVALVAACALSATPALAWDAHGHRTITLLAIDHAQKQLASGSFGEAQQIDWLFAPDARAQAAYQSGEPDRYRAVNIAQLKHTNDPDHYFDLDNLSDFGLTFATLPPLRNEYLRAMVIAKHEHPDNVTKPYNEKRDTFRTQEWPGFLPYAICEHYGKLVSSFRQIRVLSSLNDPARANQTAAARANVLFEMGQLSHFVGDAAQPLHTTQHHHGWVGDNPKAYTTNYGFHAYIDTTVLGIHQFNYDVLKGACDVERPVNANDPWDDVIAHIQRSHDQMVPLYDLQKSGELDLAPGKAFIQERLCDGASMLGSLYSAAWKASEMTPEDAEGFVNYDQPSRATPNPMERQPRDPNQTVQPTIEGKPMPKTAPKSE